MKKLLLMVLSIMSFTALADNTPVKLIVPFGTGGAVGNLAMAIQKTLGPELNRPIVIEYIPGGGGTVGMQRLIRSSPNETVLLVTTSAATINTFKNPAPYDYNDIVPLVYLGRIPFVFVVSQKLNVNSIDDWKKINHSITFASSGVGTATHLAHEYLNLHYKKQLIHVPYKSIGQSLPDLLAGRVDSAMIYVSLIQSYINSGMLNALAIEANERNAKLPNVPTFKELGISDVGNQATFFMFANKTSNTAELKVIQKAMTKILNSPTTNTHFKDIDLEIPTVGIELNSNFFVQERAKLNKILKGISLD
jgi:tripartite-type tricarboxylate transporter receptor subunit TctC